jgi:cyclophilin family peptidyl-prolyl cis-trans isomerase/HEAT repeat protein
MPRLFSFLSLMTTLTLAACATAPPPPPPAPVITLEQKLASIVRLEDRRILRPADAPPPVPVVPPPAPRGRTAVAVAPTPWIPDLTELVADAESRVRRRAALAIGRVGLAQGVSPLTRTLADPDPDVRQMAAFALGLIGDRQAVAALTQALTDPEPRVRGRAAEALGLIGDASAAAAIGAMAAEYARQGVLASLAPDFEGWPLDPPVDAWRLGIAALVRLKAYDALAPAVLDARGGPVTAWWPAAYALQRIEDPRAAPALLALARGSGIYSRAFAIRGLGTLKHQPALETLRSVLAERSLDPRVRVAAVRALAQLGDAGSAARMLELLHAGDTDPNTRLEIVVALGALRAQPALDTLLDAIAHPWPVLRAAALRSVARIDPDHFVLVVSGLDPDPDWTVRAALAETLGLLDPALTGPRLMAMLEDSDKRVLPAVLQSLTRLKAPGIEGILLKHLGSADVVVRAAAARLVGELKPQDGARALAEAYQTATPDGSYVARAAALDALAQYGAAAASETLRAALADKEWAVRVKAADLLRALDPGADSAHQIRPVPETRADSTYEDPDLLTPRFSPHVYLETAKGTIQIELAVLDAPLTSRNFLELARKGYFNGLAFHRVVPNFVIQDGDPRGDGEGGPGYTIRDELNDRPYLRGTVGMALDWRDTGGSQFFITHSPQPHLDARYTVFGRVVSGMDVVDRIQQGDRIDRARVWDGVTFTSGKRRP